MTAQSDWAGWRGFAYARIVAIVMALGWGWYITLAFRTQQFGFSVGVLLAALIFVLPAALLPFLGLQWRTVAMGVALLLLLTIGSTEVMASLEERAFQQHIQSLASTLESNDRPVVQPRQWPFAYHSLLFDPASGTWRATD